ncbi:MAG: hypothetical protein KDD22_07825 [Bdellovibrionales bacterium]|nr:hypothetical protein [Bdellovibrionales bacterium]
MGYILGISVTRPQKTLVLTKNGEVVRCLQDEVSPLESDDPLPAHLIHRLLDSTGVAASAIKKVHICSPWRSPENSTVDQDQWLRPLKDWGRKIHQDWVFGSEIREEIEELLGEGAEVTLVDEDLSRTLYAQPRCFFKEGVVLNLHSQWSNKATSLWQLRPKQLIPLKVLEKEKSIEGFVSQVAEFCGFAQEKNLSRFLTLAPMGEPSQLEVFKDELWQKVSQEHLFESLKKLFGIPRSLEAPVTLREIDMASTAQALIQLHAENLARFMDSTIGAVQPLLITSETSFGSFLKGEFAKLRPRRECQWLQVEEGYAEAMGCATSVDSSINLANLQNPY